MRKKVLVIAYAFAPMSYAGTFRTLRFSRYLPENGWTPVVLTIQPGKSLITDNQLLERVPEGTKVYRTPDFDPQQWYWDYQERKISSAPGSRGKSAASPRRKSLLAHLPEWIKRMIVEFVNIPDHNAFWIPVAVVAGIIVQLKERCDLIYCSSPPHSSHLTACVLSLLFRKPWIADMRDPIVDNPYYRGSRYKRAIDILVERLILRNASHVTVVSGFQQSVLSERYPGTQQKLTLLPNGYDPRDIDKNKAAVFDRFTIIYSGSFPELITPEFFFSSFSEWIRLRKFTEREVQVLVFGQNAFAIKPFLKAQSLEKIVQVCGYRPQNDVFAYQKGAHVQLVLVGFEASNCGTVTSKIFNYMACKRPILAIMPPGDARSITLGYSLLHWVDRPKRELVHDSLDKLYSLYGSGEDALARETQKIDGVIRAYSAPVQTSLLADIFNRTVASSRHTASRPVIKEE